MWQENVNLQDNSIDCSYYSASLLKIECCKLLPSPCSQCYSQWVSALSQQGARAVMTLGPTDWLSHLWQRPHPGNGLSFSECISCREQEGALNKGSFSLTNTVTQLPVKWVRSCTQTVPLLSASFPLQGDAIMSQVLLLYNCSLYGHWVIVNKQLIICSSPCTLLSFIS